MSSKSTGGNFTHQLYVIPWADANADGYWIADEELPRKQQNLSDVEEEIQHVFLYSNPLCSWQAMNIQFYHAFVVIQTTNWWWSVEKNMEHITIQRSPNIESVRDFYQGKKRTTGLTPWTWIRKNRTAQGRNTTINELIYYIWMKDCLNKDYHILNANCQKFAQLIFYGIDKEILKFRV